VLNISEFDKVFSVCRAFSSEHPEKKIFQNAFVLMEMGSKYCKRQKSNSWEFSAFGAYRIAQNDS
jgi:hypothetical protein